MSTNDRTKWWHRFLPKPAVAKPARVIDYTRRGWGHDLSWDLGKPDGTELRAVGWTTPLPDDGDLAILYHREVGTTRYRFTNVRAFGDPSDMWSATLIFAPRTAEEKETR